MVMENESERKLIAIPHSKPTLGPEEIKAASEVVSSGYVAEGAAVQKFVMDFGNNNGFDIRIDQIL